MIGDGSNALNGFGGGQYQPPDTRDYDPDLDGCPVCGNRITDADGDNVYCDFHGWFDYAGRPINEEAQQ